MEQKGSCYKRVEELSGRQLKRLYSRALEANMAPKNDYPAVKKQIRLTSECVTSELSFQKSELPQDVDKSEGQQQQLSSATAVDMSASHSTDFSVAPDESNFHQFFGCWTDDFHKFQTGCFSNQAGQGSNNDQITVSQEVAEDACSSSEHGYCAFLLKTCESEILQCFRSDYNYDKFLTACDLCERCSICTCLLSCGGCVHVSDSPACSHCSECSEKFENSSDTASQFCSDEDESTQMGSPLADDLLSKSSLRDNLGEWAVDSQIKHAALNKLLGILNAHHPEDNLPRDARALLGTVDVRDMPPGQYWHNGLKKNLVEMFSGSAGREIYLSFNVDGLPISKSSGSQLWPILCCVQGTNHVFAVGIYHGHAKPDSESVYLEELVQELKDLLTNGIDIGNEHFRVLVLCYVCDAPAKCFILGIKGHCGYWSCLRCLQKGEMIGRRMCFPEVEYILRTDESFLLREQPEHHLDGTPKILEVPGIKPVSQFVHDPMHLLYIGVMKKLLLLWLFGDRSVKMSKKTCMEISAYLIVLTSYVPVGFARQVRALEYVCKYKATELRQMLCYVGPIIFKQLKGPIYENFMVLHVATRLLNSADTCVAYNDYAGELMKNFVSNFKVIYGEEYVSHNVHGCLHVHQDVLRYGPLESYSAFKFENFLQKLKWLVHKGEKPLQQIVKRYSEMDHVMLKKMKQGTVSSVSNKFLQEHNDGPLVDGCGNPQYKKYQMGNAVVNVQRKGDCCAGLHDGSVVLIQNFAYNHASGLVNVIGLKYKYKDNLYSLPIQSSSIGIFQVFGLSSSLQSWPTNQISHKFFRMPYKEGRFAVFPLMH